MVKHIFVYGIFVVLAIVLVYFALFILASEGMAMQHPSLGKLLVNGLLFRDGFSAAVVYLFIANAVLAVLYWKLGSIWLSLPSLLLLVWAIGTQVMDMRQKAADLNREFLERRELRRPDRLSPESYFADAQTRLLVKAALSHDLDGAKKLVTDGADPERGVDGRTPLDYAILTNDPDLLKTLLDLKPISRLSPETQRRLLFESVKETSPGCLEVLLERGVPLDLRDPEGYTIFLRSLDLRDLDLALWLARRGASLDVHNENGMSAAWSVSRDLEIKTGERSRKYLLEIKRLMIEKGIPFPGPSPKEIREGK